jgi:hypothetical protein
MVNKRENQLPITFNISDRCIPFINSLKGSYASDHINFPSGVETSFVPEVNEFIYSKTGGGQKAKEMDTNNH